MASSFSDKFSNALTLLSETEKKSKLLVAVSGGGDSMAMVHALYQAGLNFMVAHVNYKQRGEESDADEQLVQTYCKDRGIELHIRHWPHGKNLSSFQEKARDFRYAFFKELVSSEKCTLLLTAHHENDRIEGFLYNMARGAGLAGVDALVEKNDAVFRPLFRMSKEEISEYLEIQSVPFRHDESNFKTHYRRNYIRHELVPKIEEIHPGAIQNMVQLLDKTKLATAEIQQLYKRVAAAHLVSISSFCGGVVRWDVVAIKKEVHDIQGFLFYVLHQQTTEFHQNDVAQLAKHFGERHPESKVFYFGDYCLEFFEEEAYSYHHTQNLSATLCANNLSELQCLLTDAFEMVEIKGKPSIFEKGKMYLDANKLSFPLTIRPPRDGDKIKLFGMGGKAKKVSDLLTQENNPQWKKKTADLIFDADNELVIFNWKRHSIKVAVNDDTKNTIILS